MVLPINPEQNGKIVSPGSYDPFQDLNQVTLNSEAFGMIKNGMSDLHNHGFCAIYFRIVQGIKTSHREKLFHCKLLLRKIRQGIYLNGRKKKAKFW
jgi:hypothetical protein